MEELNATCCYLVLATLFVHLTSTTLPCACEFCSCLRVSQWRQPQDYRCLRKCTHYPATLRLISKLCCKVDDVQSYFSVIIMKPVCEVAFVFIIIKCCFGIPCSDYSHLQRISVFCFDL